MDNHQNGDGVLQDKEKDSILTVKARRQIIISTRKIKGAVIYVLPFAVIFWLGLEWGKAIEANRIHNDCKFTGTFRIADTGYGCRIGRM